jgi:hypothetical protein
MPGNAMAEPAAAAQITRAQKDTAARSVHPLSRHHAERREVRENAHTAAVMYAISEDRLADWDHP